MTQKHVYAILNFTGPVIGNSSVQPLQPVGINIVSFAQVLVVVTGAAGAVARLLTWLSWRTKHGESRTPVVLLPQSRKGK